MATMRVAQVPQPNGPLELVEREIPQPSAGQVRIKVQACGVCHSDSVTKQGLFPNIQYPRVPGHEVIGSVDAIGSGVAGWSAGQRVGVGWHGDLGVQFAAKMGFKTIAIARGQDKAPLARQLGAHHYIDSRAEDPAAALQKFGGAKVILATATSGAAMDAVQGGLAVRGTLLIVGVPESFNIAPQLLIFGSRSITGWYSGTSIDSQQTLAFSALTGVRSMNEVYPLARAAEAYDRMMIGEVL